MCILFLPEQWKWYTKLIYLFLFRFLINVCSVMLSTFDLLMSKRGLTGKGKRQFLFCFKASSGSLQNVTPWGCQQPCSLSRRCNTLILRLLWVSWTSTHYGSQEFCALRMLYVNRGSKERQHTYILCISSLLTACFVVGLHPQNTKSKIKLRIYHIVTWSYFLLPLTLHTPRPLSWLPFFTMELGLSSCTPGLHTLIILIHTAACS